MSFLLLNLLIADWGSLGLFIYSDWHFNLILSGYAILLTWFYIYFLHCARIIVQMMIFVLQSLAFEICVSVSVRVFYQLLGLGLSLRWRVQCQPQGTAIVVLLLEIISLFLEVQMEETLSEIWLSWTQVSYLASESCG